MDVLRRAANDGALAIAVTHDLGLAARYADRVLVVSEGRLAAAGPPDAALAPEVVAAVFRIVAFRAEHETKPRDRTLAGGLISDVSRPTPPRRGGSRSARVAGRPKRRRSPAPSNRRTQMRADARRSWRRAASGWRTSR